ncbi:hypothetical protein LCM4579_23085 [Ensifer sp. LCM 4579]|nr:hypothetical protein LCM4579_23085 [Ensifer sp. LCM 4579]
MRAWQSLFMRSHRDDGDAEQLIFNFSGSSIAHNEVKARDSQALWILDDIKLVAPAFGNLWPLPASVSRPSESIDHITRIVGADVDASLLDDAAQFYTLVKDLAWAPSIWADEGEIGFEWIRGDKHAIVSIDGGGSYGYTLLRGEAFEPGAYEDPRVSFLPQDLREYLEVA